MSNSCRVYAPATVLVVAIRRPLTKTSAAEITPLKSRWVRAVVSATVKSERYHQGTVKSAAGISFCWVERKGSGYTPAASSAASTVERGPVGYQPVAG